MAMETIRRGELEYLVDPNMKAPHAFTTRRGGVSKGYLESLNLGTHRGDSFENVEENFAILGRELGFSPRHLVCTKQVHSDTVLSVGEKEWGAGLYAPPLPPCDGLITNAPGTALVVFTADCTPILLYDPVTGAVGAAHAGWRGTALSIGEKTVRAMERCFGCRPENIRAAIGPNIGPCCFETDGDVPKAMERTYGQEAGQWISRQGDKYYVNLKALNELSLRRAGVTRISVSGDCTACQSRRFWSHRVAGGQRGSQGAVILCGEVSQ